MKKPRFACPHPPMMQPESPGILGVHDAASPDDNRIPEVTPGIVGVHDANDGSAGDTLIARRLQSAWDEIEASRSELVHLYLLKHLQEASSSGYNGELEEKNVEAWETHRKLGLAYFGLVAEYLRDHYDPNANWGTTLRIGWLLRDAVLQQQIDEADLSNTPEVQHWACQLAALHCERAFEHYERTQDPESLFYVVMLAAEIQALSDDCELELPAEIKSLLRRLNEENRPPTLEDAWQTFIRGLVTGIKPGDPLWARELAKVANKPMDPIREHWERSKWEGGS